jgi:hypothetical protein
MAQSLAIMSTQLLHSEEFSIQISYCGQTIHLEASVVHGIQKLAFEEFITVDPKTSGPRV